MLEDLTEPVRKTTVTNSQHEPLYPTWRQMRARCHNPNATGYESYGARGIYVHERWHCFYCWKEDMGPKPTPKHTIDRIDNDGPYAPWNCRWATRSEQARNTGRRLTTQDIIESAIAHEIKKMYPL